MLTPEEIRRLQKNDVKIFRKKLPKRKINEILSNDNE